MHRSQSSQEHLFQSCFFWAFIRREVLSYTGFRLWVVSSVCWYAAFIRLRSQTMPQLQSRSMRQSIRSSSLVCCEAGTKIYSPECCIPGRNSLRSRQTRKFPRAKINCVVTSFYKRECQGKNFPGDWKERKCSPRVPALCDDARLWGLSLFSDSSRYRDGAFGV